MDINDDGRPMQDIVELEDINLSLSDIEKLAHDESHLLKSVSQYGNSLYSKILLSLTHETFPEKEAENLWKNIVEHLFKLNDILGRDVGISVASLDYLTNIVEKLEDPKIIEEEKSTYIADAATKDELTGLYLRDVFDVVLKKEVEASRRTKTPFCLIMMDIDDFKKINDQYGHLVGDEVLSGIGENLNEHVREMDTAARYGGEEMAVIMPETNLDQAYAIAERIRDNIENLQFSQTKVTMSIGISQYSENLLDEKTIIDCADKALYQAKRAGKNKVVLYKEND